MNEQSLQATKTRTRTDRLPRRRLTSRQRPKEDTTLKITPIPQTCAVDPCGEVARFVVAVAALPRHARP